jgi:DUF1365 family protein
MAIDYFDSTEQSQPILKTAIVVQAQVFSKSGLFLCLLSMPMMTIGVMLRIHMQAFKLWRKGAKYRPVPPLPKDEVTHNTKVST